MTEQNSTSGTDFAAPAAVTPTPELPPAGWYPDPEQAGQQRYWDGREWSTHRVIDRTVGNQRSSTAPRARVGAIVGWSIVGAVAVTMLLGGALNALLPSVVAATEAVAEHSGGTTHPVNTTGPAPNADPIRTTDPGDPADVIDATIPKSWRRIPVLQDGGTISRDPAWQDITEVIGAEQMEANAPTDIEGTFSVDGAWLVSGSLTEGGVAAVVSSVADMGGPAVPRFAAHTFVTSATAGAEDMEVTAERGVTTASGHSAYIMEYGYPMYGVQVTCAVGVIVDGEDAVTVYTIGSDTLGSGVDTLEAMVDSVAIG